MLYLLICCLTLIDHREGRGGVKLNCLRSMQSCNEKLTSARRVSLKSHRNVSRSGGAFKQVFGNRSETSDFYSVVCELLQSVPVDKASTRARRLQRLKSSLGEAMTESRYIFDTGFQEIN